MKELTLMELHEVNGGAPIYVGGGWWLLENDTFVHLN